MCCLDGDEPAVPVDATATATAASPSKTAASSADPDEVDISEHFPIRKPGVRNPAVAGEPAISEAQLRQMMLGLDRTDSPGQQIPAAGEEDPFMKMMSQMMAGGGPGAGGFPPAGFPGGSSPFPGMPPMPGMPQQQAAPVAVDPYTSLWRILHALVALGLGLYIALLTPFAGTKLEREHAAKTYSLLDDEHEQRKRLFFWTFATAETVLLTTRFFLDKGRAPPTGFLWTIVGYIPQPFQGYITAILRYGQIFSTVRSDILFCVFVLGACSWWRGW